MRQILPLLLLLLCTSYMMDLKAQAYEAKLKMDWEDGATVVEGSFLNNTKQSLNLNFQLIIERKSKTGNVSNNRQSGSFQVLPKRDKLVALTELNIDELDFYRIYFKIYKKGKVIAEDYIVKWEELDLELSDRNRLSNEETNKATFSPSEKPSINFYTEKQANKNKTIPKLNTEPVISSKTATPKTTPAIKPDKKVVAENNSSKKTEEFINNQNKKQTYTTTSTHEKRKQDDTHPNHQKTPTKPPVVDAEKIKRQEATKKLLTDLIEQQKAITNQADSKTTAPTPTPETKSATTSTVSTDVEFGGLIFDDSRTKTGRDFYDIFYANYIPPKGAENFNITIKELPGRGRLAQIAVLVNDNQVLLRLLQPRASIVEEQAIQSVYAIEGYLRNAAQLKKQLESVDQQGSGIF